MTLHAASREALAAAELRLLERTRPRSANGHCRDQSQEEATHIVPVGQGGRINGNSVRLEVRSQKFEGEQKACSRRVDR